MLPAAPPAAGAALGAAGAFAGAECIRSDGAADRPPANAGGGPAGRLIPSPKNGGASAAFLGRFFVF